MNVRPRFILKFKEIPPGNAELHSAWVAECNSAFPTFPVPVPAWERGIARVSANGNKYKIKRV